MVANHKSAALNITKTACHAPVRDSSITIKVLGPTFATVAALFVAIRLAVRWNTLGFDDAAIVLAFGTGAAVAGLNYMSRYFAPKDKCFLTFAVGMHGLGKEVWTVPFDNINKVLYVRDIVKVEVSG